MKKMFLSIMTILLLALCSNGLKAQDAAKDLDQLELAQKYFVGTWLMMFNDTIVVWEMKQDGNVILETDYTIIKAEKSVYSYWSYSYNQKQNNFYMFGANVNGGYMTLIGSFIAEDRWSQKVVDNFDAEKVNYWMEFLFDTSTGGTLTVFSKDGIKIRESRITKIK